MGEWGEREREEEEEQREREGEGWEDRHQTVTRLEEGVKRLTIESTRKEKGRLIGVGVFVPARERHRRAERRRSIRSKFC